MTFPLGLDNEAVEMTDASDVLRGLNALGVLTTRFPLCFPAAFVALDDPPSVFMLRFDVVEDATDIVRCLGTGGTSNSDLALLNEVETSDTRELGLERFEARDPRGAALLAAAALDVPGVLLRGSGLTLRVLAVTLGLGETGEVAVLEAVVPLRIVDVVDLTDAAIDFGRLAAGLSAADVISFRTFRLAATLLAGVAGAGSER